MVHPDDGGGGDALTVGQGDEGERAAGAVDFCRYVLMRDFVGDGEGQGLLAVAHCSDRNIQGSSDGRIAAVGSDDEFCGDAGVGEGDQGFAVTRRYGGCSHAGAEADIGEFSKAGDQLAAQQPVWQVPAKRLVRDVGGVEVLDLAGFLGNTACVDDAHDLQGYRMGFEAVPQAGLLQHFAGRLQEGGCAQIGAAGLGKSGTTVSTTRPSIG